MRKIRDVLRLHFSVGMSIRQIQRSTKVSVGSIQSLLKQAKTLNLSWPLPDNLDDSQLAKLFYPQADTRHAKRFQEPDWADLRKQLTRKSVTKQLLWEEYTQQYPNRCYSYSQFCDRYLNWLKKQRRSMRQHHKAGEVLFVDYAGQTMPIVDPLTGEVSRAQIFVAAMGASNYYYAEATWSQGLKDWLGSHVRTFSYLGGVPDMVVPDNLRSGVSKACKYDPDVNPAYQQLAAHYDTAIVPARPRKPKDKAKAEVGVQIIERWILARLRHQTFFSLHELNQCIQALLVEVNQKPFKQLPGTRKQWFEEIDRPALKSLPRHEYEYTEIKSVKVNIDYHVQFQSHLYSVPHQLVGEKLELHAKSRTVELYFQGKKVASHPRNDRYGFTTMPQHMPVNHQKHHKVNEGSLMNWAKDIGDEVLIWVKSQLKRKDHPQQAYRVCLGALQLIHDYAPERINRACKIANHHHLYRLQQLKDILASNQDTLISESNNEPTLPQYHENIRGPHSFH
ncbi:IS21 family transposase [Vibrio diazotrophicus]|jgi:transposase|uniref:IS21 family transposase n=1 Tax=Vibrio diazotrophicus TaxID=685 RepID=A0ABX4W3M9_VIBDI|nr:IS21 family transposase [Vibrio diazotrophicus]PNH95575.1 IS21 family transposase [Vibrio diazotrophicus]